MFDAPGFSLLINWQVPVVVDNDPSDKVIGLYVKVSQVPGTKTPFIIEPVYAVHASPQVFILPVIVCTTLVLHLPSLVGL